MSLGLSIGDFMSVGKLVVDIISLLKESKRSRDDYQGLIRELECLQTALIHIDRLATTESSQQLESIKYATLSCRRPLENFLTQIQQYGKSLGEGSRPNSVKAVIDRIKFPLCHYDDVQRLQSYLSVHIGSINLLLAEYGLEKMKLAADKNEMEHLQIKETLEESNGILSRIQNGVVCQSLSVFKSISILEKVYKTLGGEVRTSLQSFGKMLEKICTSTQQTYAVVLDMQTSIAKPPDVRWTFFQDPIIFEDALGRKFPVPSEYDYSLLSAIIKHKFRDGPGSAQVAAGDYEVMDSKDRLRTLSADSLLRPGCSITMAILVGRSSALLSDEGCPIPRCQSSKTRVSPDGGRICCECNVWFDQSSKKLSHVNSSEATQTFAAAGQHHGRILEDELIGKKRKRSLDDGYSMVPFKNVKLADQDTNPSMALEQSNLLISQAFQDEEPMEDESQLLLRFQYAFGFINEVKCRVQDKPEIYDRFIDILLTNQEGMMSTESAYSEVNSLFGSAPDLLEGFHQLVPAIF